MNLNTIYLTGRLTRDVDLRTLESGTAIAKTGFAHNSRYKGKDGTWRDGEPLFIDLVAWAHTANSLRKHCKKGDLLTLVGRLNFDQWEKEGTKYTRHTITVESYSLLVTRRSGDDDAVSKSAGGPASAGAADEIPF